MDEDGAAQLADLVAFIDSWKDKGKGSDSQCEKSDSLSPDRTQSSLEARFEAVTVVVSDDEQETSAAAQGTTAGAAAGVDLVATVPWRTKVTETQKQQSAKAYEVAKI
ncbi:hypothetical protein Ndes2437B_g00643 [Nannochloris sp. 'desiccata']